MLNVPGGRPGEPLQFPVLPQTSTVTRDKSFNLSFCSNSPFGEGGGSSNDSLLPLVCFRAIFLIKCGTSHLLSKALPSQNSSFFTRHLRHKPHLTRACTKLEYRGFAVMQRVVKRITARDHRCSRSLRLSPRWLCPAFPKETLQLSPDVCVKARDSQMLPYLAAWGGQAREHILLAELI